MKRLTILFYILFLNFAFLAGQSTQPANTEAQFDKNYKERIKKERLFGVYIPKDLNDAFAELDKKIDAASKTKFKTATETDVQRKLYFSLGRWMVVNWGFEGGSRLSHYLKEVGIHHPEDMALFVITTYHRKINNKELGIKELVKGFAEKRQKEREKDLKDGQILKETVIKKPKE